MSTKQELEDLELEKKRLENEKISLEIANLKKNSSIKIQKRDFWLKVIITISAIGSAILLKGVIDKEKAGLSSEKSVLKWEIVKFEEQKKELLDTLNVLRNRVSVMEDSIYAINIERQLAIVSFRNLQEIVSKENGNSSNYISRTLDSLFISFTNNDAVPVQFEAFEKPNLNSKKFSKILNSARIIKDIYKKNGFKLVRELPFSKHVWFTAYLNFNKNYDLELVSERGSFIGMSVSEVDGELIGINSMAVVSERGSYNFGFSTKNINKHSISASTNSDNAILLIFEK